MKLRLHPQTLRKLKRFRSIRRGYWSFVGLGIALVVSFFGEIIVNDKALTVRYNGEYSFPAFGDLYPFAWFMETEILTGEDFGLMQDKDGQTYDYAVNFLELQRIWEDDKDSENFVIMPMIPHGPYGNDFASGVEKLSSPDGASEHYLGTDKEGRDILARLFYGFRIVMLFALAFTLMVFLLGSFFGCIMGYFGGTLDMLGLRLVEIWANVPFLYMVMIMVAVIPDLSGSFSQEEVIVIRAIILLLIMAAFSWTGLTYYVRASTYKEKAREYVAAARVMGAGSGRILFVHVLPNVISTIVTFLPFTVATAIASVTALDFLNFGLPEGTPSWGQQMRVGQEFIREKPWIISSAVASIFIVLTMVTFIGEAVREAFDPKKFSTYE